MSELFGELEWSTKPMLNDTLSRSSTDDTELLTNADGHTFVIPTAITDNMSVNISDNKTDESTATSVVRRQKQWAIDASGVPHFLCILSKKNYLLFACDKYGCIDLYQLDGQDPSSTPRHLRQFDLFPGNTNNQKPQIIEAFTVYTPFIVVSARKRTCM
jgi:hypothetical protein